ncbi:response regulator transcription factor [Dyadobacter psychrotolerans]|uniref:Response regulator transcription factor n=1 Tax=Dyadobacter psychrotolerans TaxID=2541721 RepID=A0A4R5DM73_9BACT|nr:response regulator transcription factor [Dyadobacter psychrotolerans]TDE13184.1 response regulator transcription factor [Dyadobacter psychrotolerans]
MNILIIEDHPLIRMGLKILISQSDPAATITQSRTFPEGLASLDTERFDIVILDIDIPGGQNIGMIDLIRGKQRDILILIHSGYDEQVYAMPYLQAGADGFLSKQTSQDEFDIAFNSLITKGKYASYTVQQIMLNNIGETSTAKNPIMSLSPQEMRVMQLLVEGKWTKEIAAILNIKENTVSTFKRRIFDKLGVTDLIELSKKVSLLKQF